MARNTTTILFMIAIEVNVAASTAYIYDNQQQQCSQAHQQIQSCERYLRESMRMGSLEWIQEFPRRCNELEQVVEDCRCQALKNVVEQQLKHMIHKRPMYRQTWDQTVQAARNLPVMCRISPQQVCEVGGGLFRQ